MKNIFFTSAVRKGQQTLKWLLDFDWLPFHRLFQCFLRKIRAESENMKKIFVGQWYVSEDARRKEEINDEKNIAPQT